MGLLKHTLVVMATQSSFLIFNLTATTLRFMQKGIFLPQSRCVRCGSNLQTAFCDKGVNYQIE